MTQWEYHILPLTDPNGEPDLVDHQILMDALGMLGWELVSVYKENLIFKRPCSNTEK